MPPGPASADMAHVSDFVGNASLMGLPFDFVSTHHYPTDSCQPTVIQNSSIWDPDCYMKGVKANRASVANTTYYLTETNVGCCLGYSQHDTSAAAAFAFKTVGDLHGVADVMSWWTFSDVFEVRAFACTLIGVRHIPSSSLSMHACSSMHHHPHPWRCPCQWRCPWWG